MLRRVGIALLKQQVFPYISKNKPKKVFHAKQVISPKNNKIN
jgi:hypothetical protein